MNESSIKPEKITKPIQLLGAWLAGLFSINACFLFAATRLPQDSWEVGALTIAAIANVPLFLIAVFVLQTRFRPELQEDSYYSSYLSSKTNQLVAVKKDETQYAAIIHKFAELDERIARGVPAVTQPNQAVASLDFGINKFFSDREELAQRLSENGIVGYTLFGGDEPPKNRNVSISKHLPRETIRAVVKLAKNLGFESYNLYDNFEEDAIEDVLLGSYGDGGVKIT